VRSESPSPPCRAVSPCVAASQVKSRFILKCDEDSFVHVAKINEYLAGLGAAAAAALYAGQVVVAPVRRTGKWGVPAEVFPAAQYPPYAKGGGYLLSIDVARQIVPEIQTGRSPLLSNVEDAMVGVAADRLAMSATGLNHHFRELSLDIAAVRAASALHCCSSDTMLYHKPAQLAVCDACWAAGGLEPDTQAAGAVRLLLRPSRGRATSAVWAWRGRRSGARLGFEQPRNDSVGPVHRGKMVS